MKSLKLYIALVTVALLVYLVAVYNRPLPVNWDVTLNKKDKLPFGSYLFYNFLKNDYSKGKIATVRKPFYNVILENKPNYANYIILAVSADITKTDITKIKQFAANGNIVLLAAFDYGKFLEKDLKIKIASDINKSDIDKINFVNKILKNPKPFVFNKGIANQYFSKFDTSKAMVLGKNAYNSANLLYYPIKKGGIILCPNPQVFGNYSILKPNQIAYAEGIISYLNPNHKIIYDEFYLLGRGGDISPFRVLMSYKSLKWAYYLTLISLLVYIIYEIKRRQRIIPVIEPLKNTTLEFAKVIGQVYYQQKNHQNLAEKKLTYLWEFVRSKYKLTTGKMDEEFIEMLINKSGVERSLILEIIKEHNNLKNTKQITDIQLIEISKNIEKFYK